MTLLIGAFIVSKVFVQEIFEDAETVKEQFSEIPTTEKVYFHFYGMTLVALLTDLIIKRFGLSLMDEETEESNITQLRHKVFDGLLEPLDVGQRPKSLNYSTFKYTGPRLRRWNEVYSLFVEFVGEIIMDVGAASETNIKLEASRHNLELNQKDPESLLVKYKASKKQKNKS